MFTLPDGVGADRAPLAGPRLKILIVDDHDGTRKALRQILRRWKCGADVAENGAEALALLRQREFDLVFMDVMMPVMDGLAATRQIRQERPHGARPRIIGISTDADAESRAMCRSVGMDDFLPKPLDWRELIRVIDEAAIGCTYGDGRVDLATWILDATPTITMAADNAMIEGVVVSWF
jgi:CheY-like chemotaxis protein